MRCSICSDSEEGGVSFSSASSTGPDQRERCAQLVADVAEEGGFGSIEVGQFFGATFLCFECFGVGDAGGDLSGGKVEKAGIAGVEAGDRG